VDVDLSPSQPPEVAAAVASTIAESTAGHAPEPDPWWLAGLQEQLSA
jgi:hypothetical protein